MFPERCNSVSAGRGAQPWEHLGRAARARGARPWNLGILWDESAPPAEGGDGKQKEAVATRKLILPNLPVSDPKKISLSPVCGTGFYAGDRCGTRMGFGCPCWVSPLAGAGRLNARPQYSDMASPGN